MIAQHANSPEIKGWCPGALRPMLSGDGWLVRVRPRGGRLSKVQAQGLARLALQHGNGTISLSNRANVQLRGVRDNALEAMTAGLFTLGLLDVDATVEGRRNILVTPFADALADDIAARLEAALAATDAPDLPGKFGFAVDTALLPVLRTDPADVRIERSVSGLVVRADGAAARADATGETVVALAMELAHWFVATGGNAGGRGRMAAHLAGGAALPAGFSNVAHHSPPGPIPAPGACPNGYLVAFEFGRVTADVLADIAALGPLRLTPWRMVLIEGFCDAPNLPGLITDRDDPRLRVIACTGAPGCPQAHQSTSKIAHLLAPHVPTGNTLHVSGCAKGCAHPGTADVTLVGQPDGFAFIPDGNAGSSAAPVMALATLLSDPASLFRRADAASV